MGFSESFQDFSHYQNSSYKADPAQRDASSPNADIYAAARQQREHRSRNDKAGKQSMEMHRATADSDSLAWSGDIGSADVPQRNAETILSGFNVDSRGNVYRDSGSAAASEWWMKVKPFFKKSPRHDADNRIR